MGSTDFHRILAGIAAQVAGSAKVSHTHTFIPDFARTLVVPGERIEADGQVWHVPNDMPHITQGELILMTSEQADNPV